MEKFTKGIILFAKSLLLSTVVMFVCALGFSYGYAFNTGNFDIFMLIATQFKTIMMISFIINSISMVLVDAEADKESSIVMYVIYCVLSLFNPMGAVSTFGACVMAYVINYVLLKKRNPIYYGVGLDSNIYWSEKPTKDFDKEIGSLKELEKRYGKDKIVKL